MKTRARLMLTAAIAAAGLAVTALPATAAPQSRDAVAERTISAHTGASATKLDRSSTIHGYRVNPATTGGKQLTTYAQNRKDGLAVIAVLDHGQSRADFTGLVRAGERAESSMNGGLVILRGKTIVAAVEAPWATDAAGKSLPTSYTVKGNHIVQDVDTTGAAFPVVADPHISFGWHYVNVEYLQYTWSETWKVQLAIGKVALVAALACSASGPAVPFCAYYAGYFYNNIKSTTDAAIAHKKCLKIRMPLVPNMLTLGLAYDSYYVTCTS